MAFPTAVNDQITDTATDVAADDACPQSQADAAAQAMGNIYLTISNSIAMAAANAVYAQQQSNVTAQAATTMGVSMLYSLDTASTGVATKDIFAAAQPAQARVEEGANATLAATNAALAQLSQSTVQADPHCIAAAEPWAQAVKTIMEALAVGMAGLQQVNYQTNLDIIKQAAIALTLAQLIKSPGEIDQYQKVLNLIQEL